MVLSKKSKKKMAIQTFLATFSYPFPIILGYFVDLYFGLPKLFIPYSYFIGPVLLFFGPFIIFLATYDLVRFGKGTPNPSFPPKIFVRGGLYHYVRHPIYVGWMIFLIGGIIFFNSATILEATFIILIFIYFYTNYEERNLEKTFGKEYVAYEKKVNRWIPKIW